MKLLTNGCSFTWGGGLDQEPFCLSDKERQAVVWPHKLGELLGADVSNLAVGCGSNQRIFRTTFEWLLVNELTEDDIVIVQFTEPSRYEYAKTDIDPREYANALPEKWDKAARDACILDRSQWVACKTDVVLYDKPPSEHFIDLVDKRNQDRLSTFTDIEGVFSLISVMHSLSSLLRSKGCKYYFWCHPMNPANPNFPERYRTYCTEEFPILDAMVHQATHGSLTGNIDSLMGNIDYIKGDSHASIIGHSQLAEKIFKAIAA